MTNCASTVRNQAAGELGQNGGSLIEESPGNGAVAAAAGKPSCSPIRNQHRRLWWQKKNEKCAKELLAICANCQYWSRILCGADLNCFNKL
jgi:hypothetical protein